MSHWLPESDGESLSRRAALSRTGMGFGLVGLAGLLRDENLLGAIPTGGAGAPPAAPSISSGLSPLAPRAPHFPARAKQVVHLFMNGGPSQVDTFDPKPMLDKFHGKPLPTTLKTERKTGAAMRSPFKFRKYGESGIEVSEVFAKTAVHVDDMTIIRSMQADVPNHEPSLLLMNCGEFKQARPSVGSWITYGLGSENQNLPGFIVLCPNGYPIVATHNWRAAFLPGAFQGTYIDTKFTRLEELIANIRNARLDKPQQRRQLDLLKQLNRDHLERRQKDAQLEARLQSFELAYRMQTDAADAFDLAQEPLHIQRAYGSGVHARQLLITRRLLERGVRMVQVWTGGSQPWDNHSDLEKSIRTLGASWDQPIAAFLTDLKQRGMLDETVVMWGGEFGRTPTAELPALNGRDHNHYGFTMWLAGGGVKGGYVHGVTDDFGFQAVGGKVHVHDLHATLLHLLGFDHTRLTYRYAGRDFRLTDIHGSVVHEILA